MTPDTRRITLVLRSQSADRTWNDGSGSASRMIFVKVFNVLQYALTNGVTEFDRDVERVLLDRSVTDSEFLDLLASLPARFQGDVVMVRPDDTGFLSAAGRGGDRVLYALRAEDLQFYLTTHDLTTTELMFVAA
jgi:hypothetical protein